MEFIIDEKGCLKSIKKVKRRDNIVIIPNGVKTIGNSAFFALKHIKEIIIPSSVEVIDEYAFQSCTSLREIIIPDSVKEIKKGAFSECRKLKSIIIPKSIKKLGDECFSECVSLENVEILGPIEVLYSYTFDDCRSLRTVVLPPSLKKIVTFAFVGADKIEKMVIKNKENLKDTELWCFFEECSCFYRNVERGEIIACKEKEDVEGLEKIEYGKYQELMRCSRQIAVYASFFLSIQEIEKHEFLQIILNKIINNSNDIEIIKEKLSNYKEFEHLTRRLMKKNFYVERGQGLFMGSLYKLASSLGAFCDDAIARQRACEFLYYILSENLLDFTWLYDSFDSLQNYDYNKEWTNFFMDKNNFFDLIKLEENQTGFISRICNRFSQIKEYGRSNRGNQHYRKVTLDMCTRYLSDINFDGVDEDTKDIAKELSKYTREQKTFEMASETRKEYLDLRANYMIDDHILEEELKEVREELLEDICDTVENLKETAKNKFTYEFLSKYDPSNFVVGKYCSCCAHLEGIGLGLVKASILHPDCQNLVIRDENGRIIAKSTLYINRKQGYGIFNTIAIDDDITDKTSKNLIYKKYMEAVENFIIIYNQKNKTNPIRQINVGMGSNCLENELEKYHRYTKENLEGIDFSFYGGYEGDWQGKQIVLWEDSPILREEVGNGR